MNNTEFNKEQVRNLLAIFVSKKLQKLIANNIDSQLYTRVEVTTRNKFRVICKNQLSIAIPNEPNFFIFAPVENWDAYTKKEKMMHVENIAYIMSEKLSYFVRENEKIAC